MKNPASFVKITAAFFLALSILSLLTDLFSLLFFHFWMEAMPGMKDMMGSMGPVYAWQMDHMNYYYGLHSMLSLAGLVFSLALLYKKAWALPAFTLLLFVQILIHLLGTGVSTAILCTMPDEISLNGLHFPRAIMMISSGFGILIAMGITGLYIWLWFMFRKKEVRTIFG